MILSGYIVVLFRWFIYVLFSQSFRGLLLSTSREGIGPHGFMLGHLYSVNLSADVASQTGCGGEKYRNRACRPRL